MNDPHIWWYVTRTSAVIAWALMSLSVLWGVLLSTRVLRKVDNPGKLQDLHRYLGGVSMIFIALHLISLMLDGWLHFTPVELLVPFQAAYRPIPVAIGILAFYLLLALYGSSLIRDRLPQRFWRGIHYGSYPVVLLVALHAGLSGTDAGRWWYLSVSVALIMLTGVAVVTRILLPGGSSTAASSTGSSGPRSSPIRSTPPGTSVPGTTRSSGSTAVDTRTALLAAHEAPSSAVTTLVVAGAAQIAEGVRGIRLVPFGGGELPHWQAGAHLTVELPGGLTRQYSLCGDPAERGHYEIAVLRESESRGGSAWVHHGLMPGMPLRAWEPANHFPLLAAQEYLFIAGGIGITPLRAMIEALPAKREWRLIYLGRTRSTMAFLPELLAEYPGRVAVYARDEHPARLDIRDVVDRMPGEVYCCGPEELIDDVVAAAGSRAHVERFAPVVRNPARLESLRVTARRSGIEMIVPPETSVLEALEARGVPVLASCRRGICGSCEVRVVEGVVEHLDSVLDDLEKDELGIMYPCVSRAHSAELVLDV